MAAGCTDNQAASGRAAEQDASAARPGVIGRTPQPRFKRQRRAGLRFLALLAVLAAAALIVRSRVFVLTEVRVEGNESYSAAQIAAMSGLRIGESIFAMDENAVARSFADINDVKLIDVRVELPDAVTLVVRERKARLAVNCAGVIVIVDEEGQIMQRLSTMPESGVIVVSGLNVSVNAQGRQIESKTSWQMDEMRKILAELDAQGMAEAISEINLAERYSIYLISRTGVQIMLGDVENLTDKLVWAKTVLEKLTEEGVRRGVLDVSTGRNAIYADR